MLTGWQASGTNVTVHVGNLLGTESEESMRAAFSGASSCPILTARYPGINYRDNSVCVLDLVDTRPYPEVLLRRTHRPFARVKVVEVVRGQGPRPDLSVLPGIAHRDTPQLAWCFTPSEFSPRGTLVSGGSVSMPPMRVQWKCT